MISKRGLDTKGKLLLHLFGNCTLFLSPGEIQTRLRKLLCALRTVCNLTSGEVENALLGMITNGPFFAGSKRSRISADRQALSAFAGDTATVYANRSQNTRSLQRKWKPSTLLGVQTAATLKLDVYKKFITRSLGK